MHTLISLIIIVVVFLRGKHRKFQIRVEPCVYYLNDLFIYLCLTQ
jgi:hypothetical protein